MKKKILISFVLILATVTARGQAVVSPEALKAAFIYHFLNFTEWKDAGAEYVVCIPEDAALRDAAADALKGKVINKRQVTVSEGSTGCHILISENVPASSDMFTIGPLEKGALLEFRMVENKLRFAVSLANVKKSNVKISSQLLKLAILEGG